MRTVDLAVAPLRELNAALHRLERPRPTSARWRVLNPRGAHAVAAGVDAPVRVEIEGHVGYYCAGMNKAATVVINGNAGPGVAENMMSGQRARDGRRLAGGGRDGLRRAAAGRRQRGGALRHLHEGHRHRREGLGRAYVGVHGAGRQPGGAGRRRRGAGRFHLRGAAVRARQARRAWAPTASRSRCARSTRRICGGCWMRPSWAARWMWPSSSATARRARSITSTSTIWGRTDGRSSKDADRWIHTPPRKSATFDDAAIAEIRRAAATGIYDIRGAGTKRKLPHLDDLLFVGASISRYPLEGYRERCATDVTLGARFAKKPITLKIPITIAGMSFGSLSAQAKEALGRGASAVGTSTTTGDGGMTPEERGHSSLLVYQVLPSRYGMNPDDLRKADAIEVVVGQGAKPGGGGMLLGQKISKRVAAMRTLARRHRPALGLPASGLDRPRRPRDQDPRAARDHRLGEADLRQGRRLAALLRHGAGREGRRRRGGAGRHAGRHGGDAGRVHRACRHPDAGGHPAGGEGAAGAGHAPQGAADRLGRHPQRRRRGEVPGAGRRCVSIGTAGADRARRQRSATSRTSTASSAPRPAPTTTGTRAAIPPASPRRTRSWPSASIRCWPASGSPTTCRC